MSGCLDNAHCPELECCHKIRDWRNAISSAIAGILFGLAWWMAVDAAANYPDSTDLPKFGHTWGVLGTIALIMMNAISNSQVRGDTSEGGCLGHIGAKVWLFIGFLLAFASLIAAAWFLFAIYVTTPSKPEDSTPGVLIFLQNFLIFISAIVFKFGRSEEQWD